MTKTDPIDTVVLIEFGATIGLPPADRNPYEHPYYYQAQREGEKFIKRLVASEIPCEIRGPVAFVDRGTDGCPIRWYVQVDADPAMRYELEQLGSLLKEIPA